MIACSLKCCIPHVCYEKAFVELAMPLTQPSLNFADTCFNMRNHEQLKTRTFRSMNTKKLIHTYIYTHMYIIYIYIYIQKITHYRPDFFGFPFRTVSKDFTRILYLPDVYKRNFCEAHKNHAVYSMEPIIQRMQTELKAPAGNMTRAQCI